jgi:hypothetical protein
MKYVRNKGNEIHKLIKVKNRGNLHIERKKKYIYFLNIFISTKLKGRYDVDKKTKSNFKTRQRLQ